MSFQVRKKQFKKESRLNRLLEIPKEISTNEPRIVNMGFNKMLIENYGVEEKDLVLIVSDERETCNFSLGALRLQIAKEMNLIDQSKFHFLWVVNWPLFELSLIHISEPTRP